MKYNIEEITKRFEFLVKERKRLSIKLGKMKTEIKEIKNELNNNSADENLNDKK